MKTLLSLPLALVLLSGGLCAQQSTPPSTPKPIDYSVKPEEAKDLRIAQLEFQAAQRDLATAVRDWNEACEALKFKRGWPAATSCRIDNGEIMPPPPESQKVQPAPGQAKEPKK